MPKKIQECTKAHLISVPLPTHGASYTVISHQFVIDYSFQALANAGFGIVEEEYRCTADGQIAQGIYKLHYNNDPELSMMFAWTNSYNKQVKFKCLIGAYINQTGTVMTSGDIGTWTRKHMGTADTETKATIDDQITNAYMYYNQLIADKDKMAGVILNKRKQAQLLGVLFAEYQTLTTEQASIIRNQMDRPSHVYENNNSLWAFYNYVTIALQQSHPRTWMEDQRILHYFIGTVCNFSAPVQPVSAPPQSLSAPVDPLESNYGEPENQTNLLVQIAEETGDDSILKPTSLKETNPDLYHSLAHLAKAEADMLVHGDNSGFEKIKEVTEQALKDELIFGVSGVAVSADGIRNVPIEEVLEKMQEKDPMPESIENKTVAFDIPEGTEIVEKEVLMSAEVVVIDLSDPESTPEPLQDYVERTAVEEVDHVIVENEIWTTEDEPQKIATILDEVVQYTDPVGNTFEAPVVSPCAAHELESEKLEEEIKKTEVENFFEAIETESEFAEEDNFDLEEGTSSLAPTPEEVLMIEAEDMAEHQAVVEEADLSSLPAEEDNFDLDLDFNEMDSQGSDEIPDFF